MLNKNDMLLLLITVIVILCIRYLGLNIIKNGIIQLILLSFRRNSPPSLVSSLDFQNQAYPHHL